MHRALTTFRFCLLAVILTVPFISAQQEKYRIKGDNLDVPVRAGYRIMANDNDGFLEDGIIVKTKGSGYIDSRYRHRYDNGRAITGFAAQASHPRLYYAVPRVPSGSSAVAYSKYAVPDIIYGRREW